MNTYLYIKRHTVTGRCYFGKTVRDPLKYHGSGLHWGRHIKKHGKEHVETLWYHLFTDKTECTRIALLFSKQQDIVKSDLWLNMRFENGLDGGGRDGSKHSTETKAKMRLLRLGKVQSPETVAKRTISLRGRSLSNEHKAKMRLLRLGKVQSPETKRKIALGNIGKIHSLESKAKMSLANKVKSRCPHCNKEGGTANMSRYHFDNCKALITAALTTAARR